jgi:hypothetical protein
LRRMALFLQMHSWSQTTQRLCSLNTLNPTSSTSDPTKWRAVDLHQDAISERSCLTGQSNQSIKQL